MPAKKMTHTRRALLIAVPAGLLFAVVIVVTVLSIAFSGNAVSNSDVTSSGPLVQEDASAMPPTLETPACDFDEWIGRSASDVENFLKTTGRQYRIIRPGQPVTMDYRPDRINADLDENDIVIRMHCA